MELQIFGKNLNLDASLLQNKRKLEGPVQEYLDGDRRSFDGSYNLESLTEHHRKVLEITAEIPFGETRTYGEIAEEIGSAPLAVGQALKNNPIPLIIHCHRVVGKNSIGGYAGEADSSVKKRLLEHEKSLIK